MVDTVCHDSPRFTTSGEIMGEIFPNNDPGGKPLTTVVDHGQPSKPNQIPEKFGLE